MLGIIGGSGLEHALGALGQVRVARPGHPVRKALRAHRHHRGGRGPGRAPQAARRGARPQPVQRPVPRQHLRHEEAGGDPDPGHGRGGQPPRGDRAPLAGRPRPGDRQDLPPGRHLLRRSRRPRGAGVPVLPVPAQGAREGLGRLRRPGSTGRDLRLHGGAPVLDPRGERAAPLLGRLPDRDDRDAGGAARPGGGDLLRARGAPHRLRLLAAASACARPVRAARGDHRKPQGGQPERPRADPRGPAARGGAGEPACPCQSALELAIWSDRATIPAATRERLRPLLGKYLDPKPRRAGDAPVSR